MLIDCYVTWLQEDIAKEFGAEVREGDEESLVGRVAAVP